jgi:hypothetical protein
VALVCAKYITQNEEVTSGDLHRLKLFMNSKNISFNERDESQILCRKLLDQLKPSPNMPLSAFSNQLITDDNNAQTQLQHEEEERQIRLQLEREALSKALKRERRIEAIKRPNINRDGSLVEEVECSNRVFNNESFSVEIDESLGYKPVIGLPIRLYDPLINLTIDEQVPHPLVEIRTNDEKKIYVRIEPRNTPMNTIALSPFIVANIGHPLDNEIKAKLCINIVTPRQFHFILFNGEGIEDIKGKAQASIESYLQNYGGIVVGMRIPVLIDGSPLVEMSIDKILDADGTSVRVAQSAVPTEIEYSIRTEEEAFDDEDNLLDALGESDINEGNEGNEGMVFGMTFD